MGYTPEQQDRIRQMQQEEQSAVTRHGAIHYTPAQAAAIQKQQDDAFLRKRYGHKFLDDRDAHIAAVAKSAEATKLKPLLAELNRTHQLAAQQQSDIALENERYRLQSEPSPDFKCAQYVGKDTAAVIEQKSSAAFEAWKASANPSPEDTRLIVNFLQQNPADLTKESSFAEAFDFCFAKLSACLPPAAPEQPVAIVEPEPVNPHVFGSKEYSDWDLRAYRSEWQGELDIWRSAIDSLNINLSSGDVRSSYERFISHTQELAKATGQPRQEFTVENAVRFLKDYFANRVTNAPEMTAAEDAESSESLKQRVGMVHSYAPGGQGMPLRRS